MIKKIGWKKHLYISIVLALPAFWTLLETLLFNCEGVVIASNDAKNRKNSATLKNCFLAFSWVLLAFAGIGISCNILLTCSLILFPWIMYLLQTEQNWSDEFGISHSKQIAGTNLQPQSSDKSPPTQSLTKSMVPSTCLHSIYIRTVSY